MTAVMDLESVEPAEDNADYVDDVIRKYHDFINPGLAALMKFGGFGDVEVFAEGCILRTASGAEYLDCLGGYGVFTLRHPPPKGDPGGPTPAQHKPLFTEHLLYKALAQLS